jgi:NAD-dependent dihydropyrimidine dehydrogenase PreA subunit
MRIEVDKERCIGCGTCQEICPKGPRIWKIKDGKAEAGNLQYCHVCTICASKCPVGAIHVIRDGQNGEKEKVSEKD